AIILSGGPASVYAPSAPTVDPQLFSAGIPVMGICYGFQAMAQALGGAVKRTQIREFGRTKATVDSDATLFSKLSPAQSVWMSHSDAVSEAPKGFVVTGRTEAAAIAAFEDRQRQLFGVQWHPEVAHTENGSWLIRHFLRDIVGLPANWTAPGIVDASVAD